MTVYPVLENLPENAPPRCAALGLFDGLHRGHRAVIEQAVGMGEELGLAPCVFTFSTEADRPAAKSPHRLLTDSLRDSLLAEWGVQEVFCPSFGALRDKSPAEFVRMMGEELGIQAVCCGENFRFGRGAAASAEDLVRLCGERGIRIRVVSLVQDGSAVSSTRIRQAVAAGEIPEANRLLGRRFAIDFVVALGRQLGRTFGTPTINQPFPERFVTPRFGVYATAALLDGILYPAVTNVGVKPTVGSDGVLAETYIHGFQGDLYGQRVRVEFLEFVRPEQKFASVEELKAQILRDSKSADAIARQYGVSAPVV